MAKKFLLLLLGVLAGVGAFVVGGFAREWYESAHAVLASVAVLAACSTSLVVIVVVVYHATIRVVRDGRSFDAEGEVIAAVLALVATALVFGMWGMNPAAVLVLVGTLPFFYSADSLVRHALEHPRPMATSR